MRLRRVYLDSNATTPLQPAVARAMRKFFTEAYGNPSSIHQFGRTALVALDTAREEIATCLGATEDEVFFTGSGTEADNLAIVGAARAYASKGRHLIVSKIEHPAVIESARALEKEGFEVTYLAVRSDGVVEPETLSRALRPDTILVSVMLANNETGAIEPIARLSPLVRGAGAVFHTDAVQAFGKIPVNVTELGVDLLSISAHKFHGPKGVGALYVRKGTRVSSLVHGGPQEGGLRAGTENVPGIVGLAEAASVALQGQSEKMREVRRLRDRLHEGLWARIAGLHLNGPREERLPNTLNVRFENVEGEALLLALDLEGIAVSTGSACGSGAVEPSHVLKAMGLAREEIQGSLRFSLSVQTTDEEIDYCLEKTPAVVEKVRRMKSRQ